MSIHPKWGKANFKDWKQITYCIIFYYIALSVKFVHDWRSFQHINLVLKNQDTSFNEEAKWYKALTLIALNKKDKAKELLKGIIKSNGFYKTNAEEKLKKL